MTEKMYKRALKYIKKGWVIIPLSSPKDKKQSPGKRPIIRNWQLKSKNPSKEIIKEWFLNEKNHNIGLQCGKNSNVTAIDFDSFLFKNELFDGLAISTLHSERTEGRGHYLFQYTSDLKSIKRGLLGFEIMNDGNQIVLPPSIHKEGQKYRWEDKNAPLQKMPKKLKERINSLVETEQNLNTVISKCRSWVKCIWKEKLDVHDESAMLAIAAELKANGAEEEEIHMFCKIMLGDNYDEKYTSKKWTRIVPKPWKNDTLKSKLPPDLQQYVVPERHREFNPTVADHEIVNRVILLKLKFRIQEDKKTKDAYFIDRKTHKKVAKLRFDKESGKYFDDNFRNEGVSREVDERNSPKFAYYLMELKRNEGIPVGKWEPSTKTCETRTYKRMVQEDFTKSWVTEYYVVCRTRDNGKWKICNEYVPKYSKLDIGTKKLKIRKMFEAGIPPKTLSDIFGYSEPSYIRKLVKDLRRKPKKTCKLR